jgi:hypothetical protein
MITEEFLQKVESTIEGNTFLTADEWSTWLNQDVKMLITEVRQLNKQLAHYLNLKNNLLGAEFVMNININLKVRGGPRTPVNVDAYATSKEKTLTFSNGVKVTQTQIVNWLQTELLRVLRERQNSTDVITND